MKTWRASLATALICSPIILRGQAQDSSIAIARMDEVVRSYTAGNAFMGAVLVVDGDKTLLNKGYGLADAEWNIPNAPDVEYRIGSLTKQFTATLVLLLREEGKLHIEDPVSRYLPDAPPAWAKITLANLLGHTSGIPNFTRDKDFPTWSMSPHTPAEDLAFFRDKPLVFEPGSQYEYSNSNFVVLGAVLEKVSGETYGELLRQRIFEPLALHNTGLDSDDLVLPRHATGYRQGKDSLLATRSMSLSVPWSAGAIYSTTGDLLRWEQALFGGKVLNEASLNAMTTPGRGDYGLGLGIARQDGFKVLTHPGEIQGFSSQMSYVPERKIGVIILGNVNGPAPPLMAGQLLDLALGKPVTLASERKPVPIAAAELAKFPGVYEPEPNVTLTISIAGASLGVQINKSAVIPMMYQGLPNGHPLFYVPRFEGELEFLQDSTGNVASLILHRNGDTLAKKR